MKPIWIKVELSGAAGTPPCGVMTRGSCDGIAEELEVGAVEEPEADVADWILDWGVRAVAVSVPVGLILSGAVVEALLGVTSALV